MNSYGRIYNLLTEVKGPESHGADVFQKKLGNAGPGETKRAEAARKASEEATERRRKRLKAVKFKRGQKLLGGYKGFVPGTPESRPLAASERENLARQGMVPPRVGGRTRRGMR
tara:strand:- start:89 stop:430 length:342 start_codon:yes stop_codon:yes gene_type:complete